MDKTTHLQRLAGLTALCGARFVLILLAMLTASTAAMAQVTFIKDVKVGISSDQGTAKGYLTNNGYTLVDHDLNNDTKGQWVYVGYKTTTAADSAITGLVVVATTDSQYGEAAFTEATGTKEMYIDGKRYYRAETGGGPDMNSGNKKHNNNVYLYYTRDRNSTLGSAVITTLSAYRGQLSSNPDGWLTAPQGGNCNYNSSTGTYYMTADGFGDTNCGGGGTYNYIIYQTHTHSSSLVLKSRESYTHTMGCETCDGLNVAVNHDSGVVAENVYDGDHSHPMVCSVCGMLVGYNHHSYDESSKVVNSNYLASAATCHDPAKYYYKCKDCGKRSIDTYEYGDSLGHGHTKGFKNWISVGETTAAYTLKCQDCEEYMCDGTIIWTERWTEGTQTFKWGTGTTKKQPATCVEDGKYIFTFQFFLPDGSVVDTKTSEITITADHIHSVDCGMCSVCGRCILRYGTTDNSVLTPNVTNPFGSDNPIIWQNDLQFETAKPITQIVDEAFRENTKLKYILLPPSCKTIGERAFAGCTNLWECDIYNSGVETIGMEAFYNCSGLVGTGYAAKPRILMFPSSVKTIGPRAFRSTASSEIDMSGSGVTTIGLGAFVGMANLEWVFLSSKLDSVAASAFSSCSKLERVWVYAATPPAMADLSAFDIDSRTDIILYGPCSILSSYRTDDKWKCFRNFMCSDDHNYVELQEPVYLYSRASDCTSKNVYYRSCSGCGRASASTFDGDAGPHELSVKSDFCQRCMYVYPAGADKGSGTPEDPYQIWNISDLYRLSYITNGMWGYTQNTSACAKLMCDMDHDINNKKGSYSHSLDLFPPLAQYSDTYAPNIMYSGTFDGQGYCISGLCVEPSKVGMGYETGFVSRLRNGTVKNLILDNPRIVCLDDKNGRAGAIAGLCWTNSNILNCAVVYPVIVSDYGLTNTGAIVGQYAAGTIKNCWTSLARLDGAGNAFDNCFTGLIGHDTSVTSTDLYNHKSLCAQLNQGVDDGTGPWSMDENLTAPPFLRPKPGRPAYAVWVDSNANPLQYEVSTEPNSTAGNHVTATISNAYRLNRMAQYIRFYGKEILDAQVTSDIDYTGYKNLTDQVGYNYLTPYTGTFNGNNHTVTIGFDQTEYPHTALFRVIRGATIKNLHVSGTIASSNKFAGGVASWVYQTPCTLQSVTSDVTINSTKSGDGTHGGLVALTQAKTTFENCAFTGTLNGSSTSCWGGMVGWADQQDTYKGCYVAIEPASTGSVSSSATFSRGKSPNGERDYYTTAFGVAQGTAMTGDMITSGELCYILNGTGDKSNSTWADGKTDGSQAWYQLIGTDIHPVIMRNDSNTVYLVGQFTCNDELVDGGNGYTNDPSQHVKAAHVPDADGYCENCFADVINADYYDDGNISVKDLVELLQTYINYHGELPVTDVYPDGKIDMKDVEFVVKSLIQTRKQRTTQE